MADDGSPADPGVIRCDRFLPGDTLRAQLRGTVAEGPVTKLRFRIFNESWQSDFGLEDGDAFQLPIGQSWFANADFLQYIGGTIVLHIAATGATYECPIGYAYRAGRNYVKIDAPNVRPQEPYDQLITMFHQFNISLPDLALQPGDSVVFHGDFAFQQNFTPDADNVPLLINFRSAICGPAHPFAWKLLGCPPPLAASVLRLRGAHPPTGVRHIALHHLDGIVPLSLHHAHCPRQFISPGSTAAGVAGWL